MGVLDQEKVDRIKRILKWNLRGTTISDLASRMHMNRNLVAKYLDMLLISGQVEMQVIGAAKVYFLSRRVPISALLEFSHDLVIVVDMDERILQINERVPALLDEKKEAIVGRRLDETDNPFMRALFRSASTGGVHAIDNKATDISADFSCLIRGNEHHFRAKRVPTAFEDGTDGFTYIVEDVTAQKKFEEKIKISEARYRGLVQSSGEAIIGSAADGSIISWNPAAERLYGYNEIEVLNKPFSVLIPPPGHGDLGAVLQQVGQGESIRRHEMKMLRKDGTLVDVLITMSPLVGESGTIVGASSIARDITREKMEQCLREQEDHYRTLVEDLNVGIYRSTGDPLGRFVWGNTALLNILGYHSMSDLSGVNVTDIFSKPDGRHELLDELRTHRFVKNRVIHLKRRDGTPVIVSVTALAEFNDKNDLIFINGIVQDVTGATYHKSGPIVP